MAGRAISSLFYTTEYLRPERPIDAPYKCKSLHLHADTSAVVGHWNRIAQTVLPVNYSTAKTALLFAQLNTATWDASIAAYTQKYRELYWRPVTAIGCVWGQQKRQCRFISRDGTPALLTQ